MDFTIEGEPRGKGRPRWDSRHHRTYTPDKTARYERMVRKAYLESGGTKHEADTCIAVIINAYFAVPKSYSKKRRQECIDQIDRPRKKPDVDNIAKIILDALNGIAYEDDSQVVESICRKYYSHSSGYVRVTLYELNQ